MQAEKVKEKEKTTESKHMTQACWTQYEINENPSSITR